MDTVRRIETPEGVELELPVAGPLPRALAWSVDLLLRMVAYSVAGAILSVLGDTGTGLFLLFIFFLEWFYPVVFELAFHGATPGKSALGLTVVMADGTPVTLSASLLRNLLRFADLLPSGYLVGLLCMFFDPSFRRLGDMAAGTLVIHRGHARPSAALPQAPPLAPQIPLLAEEQRAIIAFAARSSTWTDGRQQELAGLLGDLLGDPSGSNSTLAVRKLCGMARWLQGER
ncbi:MAG: RDD family protein [Oligoflexia bacterium]|nr:RDD family protein [Oligoflexia bacterium]